MELWIPHGMTHTHCSTDGSNVRPLPERKFGMDLGIVAVFLLTFLILRLQRRHTTVIDVHSKFSFRERRYTGSEILKNAKWKDRFLAWVISLICLCWAIFRLFSKGCGHLCQIVRYMYYFRPAFSCTGSVQRDSTVLPLVTKISTLCLYRCRRWGGMGGWTKIFALYPSPSKTTKS